MKKFGVIIKEIIEGIAGQRTHIGGNLFVILSVRCEYIGGRGLAATTSGKKDRLVIHLGVPMYVANWLATMNGEASNRWDEATIEAMHSSTRERRARAQQSASLVPAATAIPPIASSAIGKYPQQGTVDGRSGSKEGGPGNVVEYISGICPTVTSVPLLDRVELRKLKTTPSASTRACPDEPQSEDGPLERESDKISQIFALIRIDLVKRMGAMSFGGHSNRT
ncbi:hypothetical protein PRIPAC_76333 [Pristionchus pacificus]|uniref:Uncharacterized protein n=1 Tax=Pristionchus pacificus TaxID=54126 RepID=A0A2A6BZL7_PRIPA|nr:hypothetical protein PRIPAC_76333 [Pristionchus pacificus]|eukprot:PDM71365.1 hypothetical protein PRIPAC_37772 [Pristionchus pacificus]